MSASGAWMPWTAAGRATRLTASQASHGGRGPDSRGGITAALWQHRRWPLHDFGRSSAASTARSSTRSAPIPLRAPMADSRGPDAPYPPPVLFVLGLTAGWALDRAFPSALTGPAGRLAAELAGGLLVTLGLAVSTWGFATFRAARTAIRPNRPASTLVTHGPFRFSRNPMYLGLT